MERSRTNVIPLRQNRWVVLAPAVLAMCVGAHAAECVGVLRNAGRTYVALRDTPGDAAVWVGVGDRFGQDTLARFVPERDVAVLVAPDGAEHELPLATAATRGGGAPPAKPAALPQRTIQLAVRAAYQLFYDTGLAEVSGAMLIGTLGPARSRAIEEASRWRIGLTSDGGVAITDDGGRTLDATEIGPVHILVQPGQPLAEVAAKLRLSAAQLAALNPDFVNPASETMRRTVRVR